MTTRRPGARARWWAPLLVVLLAAVALPGGVSAARLQLTGSPTFSAEAATRCDDAVTVTPTGSGPTTSVTISGLAPACAGLPLRVQVWSTSASSSTPAAFTSTGTAPATGSTAVLTSTTAFTPSATQRALVMLASWPVPTTWVPPAPDVACTVTGVVRWVGMTRVVDPPAGQTCSAILESVTRGQSRVDLDVRITTTATAVLQWSLAVNFADPAIAFAPRSLSVGLNAGVTSACSALPLARISGDAPLNDVVTASTPRDVTVRGHLSATGGADLTCP